MGDPRVRFSPAPTGSLHVGSARTALFNFLFARHHGGTFLLRIEDTDQARSRPEWAHGIEDTLHWLGLDWDGEPVHQSARIAQYHEAAEQLLGSGDAYESFETPDELDAISDERKARGLPPGYDGRARDLTLAQREALRAEGRPRTIRFRTPDEGRAEFYDLIRGDVSVDWSSISDFVIVRSDGAPLFYLANAVDDLAMSITHVIRGEDLIDSTHRVLAIRAALGASDRPAYAHLPLILGPDRAKLSKRHGAVALEEFRAGGYLPEAVCNYLALLGWSPPDGEEVRTLDEIVEAFDLDRVTHSNAAFDHAKLDWINGEWMRRLDLAELEQRVAPLARERFGDSLDPEKLRHALALGQARSTTLVRFLDQATFLFVDESKFKIEPAAWDRLVHTDRIAELLDAVIAYLEDCEWNADALDLRPVVAALGLKPRAAMPALYAAIEGKTEGLPLFQSLELLGRETSLRRLRNARARLS